MDQSKYQIILDHKIIFFLFGFFSQDGPEGYAFFINVLPFFFFFISCVAVFC